MSYNWSELPDVNDVYDSLKQQAALRAQLKVAKLQLEIYQAELCKAKPRDTSVKLLGIDEESRAKLAEMFSAILTLESALDEIDAQVKFNSQRIEAAKLMSFRTPRL
jgi:hypothetical protein